MAQRKGRHSIKSRGTAPSAPDLDKLEKMEPHPEGHHPSDVDAMGQDKRRAVVGHAYGPSRRSQILFFVAVGAVLVIVVGGFFAAVAAYDQPADNYPAEAPWAEADATQVPTKDPSGPCGEPGNAYPQPAESPCATGETSENEPPTKGTGNTREAGAEDREPGQEQGPGGITP